MRAMVLVLFLGMFALLPVHAASVDVDKSSYSKGESIVLSGSLDTVVPNEFVTVQILNPPESDFVQVDAFPPNSDGSFTKTYKADGPKWTLEGTYTLKLFYNGENYETVFEFVLGEPEPEPEPVATKTPDPKTSERKTPELKKPELKKPEPLTDPVPPIAPELPQTTGDLEPKTHIAGFPSLDKSPQYYVDRYDSEPSYQDWFDSQFPAESISAIVSYPKTHISGFPSPDKSPQYYIDRYDGEPSYQDWFDSQFLGKSIYNVMGFPNPAAIPDWIKNNAMWWSTGKIGDEDFVSGIEYMIENDIILIRDLPDSPPSSDEAVPSWVRNNAKWWALDEISEKEFIGAIKYLIEKGIIVI